MEKYPIIRFKRGKAMRGNEIWKKRDVVTLIKKLGKENDLVYVIDLDGYKKNSANLKLYKKVGKYLWVDSYPRYLEDVMDIIISGVERITIRDMKEEQLKEVKDISEKDIFLSGKNADEIAKKVAKYKFNGIVLSEEQEIAHNLQTWKIYMSEGNIMRIK